MCGIMTHIFDDRFHFCLIFNIMCYMDFLIFAITLGTIGKVLLGIAVLRVHWHIFREHRIDKDVLTTIKKERVISILAIFFILAGYALEVVFYSGTAIM